MTEKRTRKPRRPGVVKTTAREVKEGETAGAEPKSFGFPADADYYVRWRNQLRDWLLEKDVAPKLAGLLLLLPDFVHLLVKLTMDSRVPLKEKVIIGMSIAYFALPIDLWAEVAFGPIGLFDDLLLALFVVDRVVNRIDPAIVKEHWAGEGEILQVMQDAMGGVQALMGTRFVSRFAKLMNWANAPAKKA